MTIEEIAIKTMARDIGKHLQDITRLETTNAALVEALEARIEHIEEMSALNGDDPTAHDWQYDLLRTLVAKAKGE